MDNYAFEKELFSTGLSLVAGVDEVGRGPLAGPVVSACVLLPKNHSIIGLTDSKKLSEKKREELFLKIEEEALAISVVSIGAREIDEINIYQASKKAMIQAIESLSIRPEHVLVDAMPLEIDVPTTSIIKGDLKSQTIAAASIVAKVTRDRMMYELDEIYPMYGFRNHKGYPTKQHLQMLEQYGVLDEHRRSYGPVKDLLNKQLFLDL